MKQNRAMSLAEAAANVAVGFGVAVATQALVFPLFEIRVAPSAHFVIGAVFTSVSLVGSYLLRRAFERLRR